MFGNSLLTSVTLFLSLLCVVQSQLGASFGESCSDDGIRCDPRALLSCISNTCDCIKPEEMKFDKDKHKCLVTSGKQCSYSGEEKLDCVPNGFCNSTGYCQCTTSDYNVEENYYGNSEGFCVQKGILGEHCSSDEECRKDKYLKCIDGTCSCDATDSTFDSIRKTCVKQAGALCNFGRRRDRRPGCVTDSYCDYNNAKAHYECVCNPGKLKTKKGFCLPSKNSKCDGDNPCHDIFICVDGYCQCPYSKHQYFDDTLKQCISYVRGPCLETVKDVPQSYQCVDNASCKNLTEGGGVNECICNDGYIESSERQCRLGHGQACTNKVSRCDPWAGLVCQDEKCVCPGVQTYDVEASKCRGLVGAFCSSDDDDKEDFCVSGAYCDIFRDPRKKSGVCRCLKGYKFLSNRNCYRYE